MGRDSPPDAKIPTRAQECLYRLLPHLSPRGFAITGSLAMHLHGLQHRRVLDVDVVAEELAVVQPSAAGSFLISHYHQPTRNSPKFMVQLVDPHSRYRVDIFPDLEGSIGRSTAHALIDQSIFVLSEADILRHKLQTLRESRRDQPVDPKHLDDMRVLAGTLGEATPDFSSLHLQREEFAMDTTQTCARCRESQSSAFPLAPKREVFKVLGYV